MNLIDAVYKYYTVDNVANHITIVIGPATRPAVSPSPARPRRLATGVLDVLTQIIPAYARATRALRPNAMVDASQDAAV